MGIPTGLECVLQINTGTQTTPVWATLDLIVDLDNSKQADKQEAACRRGGSFKQYGIGQIDVECSFNLLHDHADATWEVVQDAFWTRKVVHVRVLDGPFATSGTEGFVMTAYIFGNDESQPLQSNVEDSLTLAPSSNGKGPSDNPIAPMRVSVV